MSTSVQLAKNLPRTTCPSVIGEVRRSSIVPDFRSSAKSLIVNTGVKKIKMIAILPKSVSITNPPVLPLLLAVMIRREKRKPEIAVKTKQTK